MYAVMVILLIILVGCLVVFFINFLKSLPKTYRPTPKEMAEDALVYCKMKIDDPFSKEVELYNDYIKQIKDGSMKRAEMFKLAEEGSKMDKELKLRFN